ncbi:hypothetical protein ACI65C_007218 [Semiaphis heraclei]
MDVKNERNHVFNIRLAKLMGIYHILDPGTLKYRGLNVYQIALAFNLLYMGVTSIMMNVIGVNCWTVNLLLSVDFFWKADSMLYLIYKWFILIRYSDAVWNCLSITRYDFTSLRSRNIQTLDRWRRRSVRFTNVLTWLCISSIFFYLFLSMIFSKDKLLVKNLDGSIGNYRQSVMNFYFIVSDETYNTQYKTFYFIESIYLTISTLIFLAFDVLLISLVFAFCCQMKMVCSTFESLGHKSLHDNHTSIGEYNLLSRRYVVQCQFLFRKNYNNNIITTTYYYYYLLQHAVEKQTYEESCIEFSNLSFENINFYNFLTQNKLQISRQYIKSLVLHFEAFLSYE